MTDNPMFLIILLVSLPFIIIIGIIVISNTKKVAVSGNKILEEKTMEKETYTKIESVRYTGGHSTRKPSTITIAVPHKVALDVANLIEDYEKKGIVPDTGLIGIELTLRHAEDMKIEDAVDEMGDRLDNATEIEQTEMNVATGTESTPE